jgi:iron complex outermembrane receptor protein
MKKNKPLFILAFFSINFVLGQVTGTYSFPEVIVQGNRINRPLSRPVQTISVITKEQIAHTPARSIQEVLSYVAGIDVRQRGVGGVQADIGIRGGSFEQTLILINGMKLIDPQTGHHGMNIPVPLEAVERIEITKGSTTRSFGQNGIAGAINIITRLGTEQTGSISSYGADFRTFGSSLFLCLPIGRYFQNISASYDLSGGYRYNSDYEVTNLNYENGFKINENNYIRGMAGYTGRNFGANGFYSDKFPDQWEQTKTLFANLSYTFNKRNFYLQGRGYYRMNQDEFRLKRFDPEYYTNYHTSQTVGVELNSTYRSVIGLTGIGVEFRKEMLESKNLGNRQRTFNGLYLEHAITLWDRLDLQFGVHSSYYSTYKWKIFPGMDLGFQLNKSNRLYANYNMGYRVPSYTEWYYNDPSTTNNPELKPEEASTIETGYIFTMRKLKFELSYFNRLSKNLIDYVRDTSLVIPNPNKWTPENVGNVRFNGVEASLNYGINLGFNGFKWNTVGISYNYLDADLSTKVDQESRYVLNAFKHQLIGGVSFEFLNAVRLTMKLRYIERYTGVKYMLVDGKMEYFALQNLTFFGELSNITDQEYIESGFVQMPGRWVKIGCKIKL